MHGYQTLTNYWMFSKMKYLYFLFCFVSRQGFSVALETVLDLALVDQASLELTEIHLPLPPEC